MKKLLVIVGCLLFFAASCGNKVDEEFLEDINEKDCVFPDIDYMIYY